MLLVLPNHYPSSYQHKTTHLFTLAVHPHHQHQHVYPFFFAFAAHRIPFFLFATHRASLILEVMNQSWLLLFLHELFPKISNQFLPTRAPAEHPPLVSILFTLHHQLRNLEAFAIWAGHERDLRIHLSPIR
jgi:hypothetical protein